MRWFGIKVTQEMADGTEQLRAGEDWHSRWSTKLLAMVSSDRQDGDPSIAAQLRALRGTTPRRGRLVSPDVLTIAAPRGPPSPAVPNLRTDPADPSDRLRWCGTFHPHPPFLRLIPL